MTICYNLGIAKTIFIGPTQKDLTYSILGYFLLEGRRKELSVISILSLIWRKFIRIENVVEMNFRGLWCQVQALEVA